MSLILKRPTSYRGLENYTTHEDVEWRRELVRRLDINETALIEQLKAQLSPVIVSSGSSTTTSDEGVIFAIMWMGSN